VPPDLGRGTERTRIWHGRQDRVIHPDTARKVNGRLPHSRLELLDGVGHVPQLEAPGLVAGFVARHLAEVAA